MTSERRIVLDTGVIVSAVLLPRSIPRRAFDKALAEAKVLVSEQTLSELNEVLQRSKFQRYVSQQDRLAFLAAMLQAAEAIPVVDVVTDCRDPKDNKFLELALSGAATHLVSGDADLLSLHPFRGIEVITSRAFLDLT